jgi:hypothetical protein
MKSICPMLCVLLLSSCVHYSVQRDFGGNKSDVCSSGSTKEKQKCKAELRSLNKSIESNVQK